MNLFQPSCELCECFFPLIQTWYVPSWWIRHPVAEWINTRGKNLAAGAKSSQPVRHGRQALKPHKESELEVRPPSRFTWGCASRSPVVLGASHAATPPPLKKNQALSPNFQQTSVSSLELQTCLINIISPYWEWGSDGGFACVINTHRGYLLDASWEVAAFLCQRSPCRFSNKRAFLRLIEKTIPSCERLRIRRHLPEANVTRERARRSLQRSYMHRRMRPLWYETERCTCGRWRSGLSSLIVGTGCFWFY